jgi:hypothetical protein
MRGLDPRIHDEVQQARVLPEYFFCRQSAWIAGQAGLRSLPKVGCEPSNDRIKKRDNFARYNFCHGCDKHGHDQRWIDKSGRDAMTANAHRLVAAIAFG